MVAIAEARPALSPSGVIMEITTDEPYRLTGNEIFYTAISAVNTAHFIPGIGLAEKLGKIATRVAGRRSRNGAFCFNDEFCAGLTVKLKGLLEDPEQFLTQNKDPELQDLWSLVGEVLKAGRANRGLVLERIKIMLDNSLWKNVSFYQQ